MGEIPISTSKKCRKNNAFYVELKWMTGKYSTSHVLYLLIKKKASIINTTMTAMMITGSNFMLSCFSIDISPAQYANASSTVYTGLPILTLTSL